MARIVVVSGRDIGKQGTAAYQKFIWHACEECGKERWVLSHKGIPEHLKCHACANHSKGCRRWIRHTISDKYYTYVQIEPNDFFYPMVKSGRNRPQGGFAKEHRLVMAKHLGRCLESWEFVHHKNGDRRDNRIENLELTTNGAHTIAHNKGYRDGYTKGLYDSHEQRIKQLEARVTQLEAENTLLKASQGLCRA